MATCLVTFLKIGPTKGFWQLHNFQIQFYIHPDKNTFLIVIVLSILCLCTIQIANWSKFLQYWTFFLLKNHKTHSSFKCVKLFKLFRTYLFGQMISLSYGTLLLAFTDNSDKLALGLTRFLLDKRTQGFWFNIFSLLVCQLIMFLFPWVTINVVDKLVSLRVRGLSD